MDGKPSADALSDQALDRDLEAALRVEPSPEFLARVRTRVAAEPPPVGWGSRWLLPAAAALAAIALVVAVSLPRGGADISPATGPEIASKVTPPVTRPAAPPAEPADGVARGDSVERHADGAGPVMAGRLAAGVGREVTATSTTPIRRGGRELAPPPVAQAAGRPLSEVVISVEERRAFALLLASIEQRRLPPVPEDVVAEGRALEAMPLDILPLVIEPLAPAERVE